mmetsp:Transcript_3881/g.8169  ORF Transcript_3881/g.8169 Transcript_3881/m.8169 type:complete len:208 (+) Transcript_3881:1200-1823(+)
MMAAVVEMTVEETHSADTPVGGRPRRRTAPSADAPSPMPIARRRQREAPSTLAYSTPRWRRPPSADAPVGGCPPPADDPFGRSSVCRRPVANADRPVAVRQWEAPLASAHSTKPTRRSLIAMTPPSPTASFNDLPTKRRHSDWSGCRKPSNAGGTNQSSSRLRREHGAALGSCVGPRWAATRDRGRERGALPVWRHGGRPCGPCEAR